MADGQKDMYALDLGSAAGYRDPITQLRFDPIAEAPRRNEVDLYSLTI